MNMLVVSITNFVCFQDHTESNMFHLLPNLAQNLMSFVAPKTDHSFLQ